MHAVFVAAHDAGAGAHIVGDDPVAALARAFVLRMGDDVFRFGRKADDEATGACAPARSSREYPGSRVSATAGACRLRVFLILLLASDFGTPIGDGGGEHRDIDRQRGFASGQHLARGRRLSQASHGAGGAMFDGAGDERRLGAGLRQRIGDRIALFAGGTVGDEAHGIERLLRWARR